jgi:saccharopine dehydrogenase-like NADP-dependent oxidoreductase
MTATIFGLGRMGQCIAYAMSKLGYKIVCADVIPAEYKLKGLVKDYEFIHLKTDKAFKKVIRDHEPDIVISSLPYHQLLPIASYCITNNIRYCDLGGRVDVSEEINQLAKAKGVKPVFTDLGLAPGWVNIVSEHLANTIDNVDTVNMYVGGLPVLKNNLLNYMVTWSIDGLLNEYVDDCLILRNKKLITVPGMDGLETINTCLGELEAFYTSGGASHTLNSMKEKGIKDCSYKTFRYPGHIDIIKFLTKQCKLNGDAMKQVFQDGCSNAKDDKDLVILRSEVYAGDITTVFEKVITSGNTFSAMQKATAFSISTVASLMGGGILDGEYSALGYSDIPYLEFEKILNALLED